MHVAQLLNSLVITEYIEIIIALLPNRLSYLLPTLRQRRAKALATHLMHTHLMEFARAYLLKHLECNGQTGSLRFAQKQMHVLRHHDIAEDV